MTGSIALFVFGVVTSALSLQLPLGTLRAPGTGLFPLVLGLMLMGLAAGHGVQLFLARPKPAPPPTAPSPQPKRDGASQRVVLFMGACALATALLATLGYALVSFLLMLALLWILGVRKWHVVGPVALGSAVASYLVFVQWLKIPLPSGWLGF